MLMDSDEEEGRELIHAAAVVDAADSLLFSIS